MDLALIFANHLMTESFLGGGGKRPSQFVSWCGLELGFINFDSEGVSK